MMVEYLKSKLHKAAITETELNYSGSICIDEDLMKAACILPNEKVAVVNFNNGNRFETYVIKGKAGSKTIGLRGPAALLGKKGQRVAILSYALMTPAESKKHKPAIVVLDAKNKIVR